MDLYEHLGLVVVGNLLWCVGLGVVSGLVVVAGKLGVSSGLTILVYVVALVVGSIIIAPAMAGLFYLSKKIVEDDYSGVVVF